MKADPNSLKQQQQPFSFQNTVNLRNIDTFRINSNYGTQRKDDSVIIKTNPSSTRNMQNNRDYYSTN